MTPDPLQERVARVLMESEGLGAWVDCGPNAKAWALRKAAAVLADLRAAGELREYEQVGTFNIHRIVWVSPEAYDRMTDGDRLYIVREDTDD